jgi:hypothetical protein
VLVSDLTSAAGIAALAAGGIAVIALATSAVLAMRLRRVRRDQRAVLGDENQDLVSHAAALHSNFQALADYVNEVATRLDARVTANEQRLQGAVVYRALVRYDAYGEMSGRQSTSIALLDARRSGIVLSSIHHREHALVYAKQVHEGTPDLELSPEESEAVRRALEEGGAPRTFAEGAPSAAGRAAWDPRAGAS